MPIQVFDFRQDIRNLDITPEIRSRFLRFEPGTVATRHSHDLGHEVFLILAGQAEFEIDGDRAVLGPGQYCFARAHQMHQVRVLGDEPVIMYLSVTPHIEPTHTFWDAQGNRLPPRYGGATKAERAAHDPTAGVSTVDLADRHLRTVQQIAEVTAESARAQEREAANLKQALADGDQKAAKAAVDAMWGHVYRTFQAVYEMGAAWNALTPRFSTEE